MKDSINTLWWSFEGFLKIYLSQLKLLYLEPEIKVTTQESFGKENQKLTNSYILRFKI